MSGGRLWWRWTVRDLRRRWILVTTIALVIALGTGNYAALLSTSEWRRQSNDASFALLHTHDVRVRLSAGATVGEGTLSDLVAGIPSAEQVRTRRERLVLPTQVAAPGGVLASGELVGAAVDHARPVDSLAVSAGRPLAAADDGENVAVLEQSFARAHDLPATGPLTLSGGRTVDYVGVGQQPEHFLVSGGQGLLPFLSQSSFAVVFTTLATAQELTGNEGRVNDLVLTLADPAARETVVDEMTAALGDLSPAVPAEVTTRDDLDSYRVLYDDIDGDEQLWRILALLTLGGAVLAALNLTTRVVESQRREIGIGMALGAPDGVLAVRPLLFGAQVALLGVILGLGVGWLLAGPLLGVFEDLLPLPVWRAPFQPEIFAQAAALGFVLPFAAVVWPVVRAVRVQPVQAIRVGHLAPRNRNTLVRRVALPGRSYQQTPVRNLLRAPRRTLLTALGLAAAVSLLVTNVGFLDTFSDTLDRSGDELLRQAPDRLAVSLREVEPLSGAGVAAVAALPEVGQVTAGLLVPAQASAGGEPIDLVAEVLPPDAPWVPSLVSGSRHGGLVLSEEAARDLRVDVGDTVRLRQPVATPTGLDETTTEVAVVGLHPNPMRVLAYLDETGSEISGLSGATNLLTVTPATGYDAADVRLALLDVPQVAAAEAGRTTVDGMRTGLEEFRSVLEIAAVVTLLLALLIAFNTASIGMDERRREHATMLAFGLPVRTVLGLSVAESLLLGVLGTALGLLGGFGILTWMMRTTVPEVLPEIGVVATVAPTTIAWVVVLGVATVAVAPLLGLPRLRRTDVPTTLRLVE